MCLSPLRLGLVVCALGAGTVSGATPGSFGDRALVLPSLKGNLYFLEDGDTQMPDDVLRRKPQGVVYVDRLDVPERDFTEGFPGVAMRLERFGLLYTGAFELPKAGTYHWRLLSDDGSRLWIDGHEIINNDGVHGPQARQVDRPLTEGLHIIKVWYFQGPAGRVTLRLFITEPQSAEKIFVVSDYATTLTQALKQLDTQVTAEGVRVRLDAASLFEPGKAALKPGAEEPIVALAQLLATFPGATAHIEGCADSAGPDPKLSLARAELLKKALEGHDLKRVKLETKGPARGHSAAEHGSRAKGRQVEVLINP